MPFETTHHDETLRRAEERFRLVIESSPAAMVIVNHQGRIEFVNRQTENWFGYRREELIGQPRKSAAQIKFSDTVSFMFGFGD